MSQLNGVLVDCFLVQNLTLSFSQAETRAEFAERSVAKLEKSIDDLEGMKSLCLYKPSVSKWGKNNFSTRYSCTSLGQEWNFFMPLQLTSQSGTQLKCTSPSVAFSTNTSA